MVQLSKAQSKMLKKMSVVEMLYFPHPYTRYYGEGTYRFKNERKYANRCTVEVLLRNKLVMLHEEMANNRVVLTDAGRRWVSNHGDE